jgi:transketolase
MRKEFFNIVYDIMIKNKNVYVLTADLGYMLLDNIKRDFKDNFYNVGAAEQLLIGAGIGLALSNKIPICYSITPFLLCRPFELIRTYINNENIPVKLVGSGRGKDYFIDGFTHWAEDDTKILEIFPNIKIFRPETNEDIYAQAEDIILNKHPTFISLSK